MSFDYVQTNPPVTREALKEEMRKLIEGHLTEEEEKELGYILEDSEELLDCFLLRFALRRCIREQLSGGEDEPSS